MADLPLLLFEQLRGDQVIVVALKELSLLAFSFVASGGELSQLLFGACSLLAELVLYGLLELMAPLGLELDVSVQFFDSLFDAAGLGSAETAVWLFFGMAAQANVVLVGGLFRFGGGDDKAAVADAAVDGGFEVMGVADGAFAIDAAGQDGLDFVEGGPVDEGWMSAWVVSAVVADQAEVEGVGQDGA